jgi:hypothetical protein
MVFERISHEIARDPRHAKSSIALVTDYVLTTFILLTPFTIPLCPRDPSYWALNAASFGKLLCHHESSARGDAWQPVKCVGDARINELYVVAMDPYPGVIFFSRPDLSSVLC